MGNLGNKIENAKINQIIQYYSFHKKIECIFKSGYNPFFKYQKSNKFKKITNIKNEFIFEEELHIIDNTWIDYWKTYSNYETAKSYFDKIQYDENNESKFEKEIKEMCQNMLRTKEINSEGERPPHMFNELEGNHFRHKLILDISDFNYVINDKTYQYFTKLCKDFLFDKRTKTTSIKANISDRIINLIFEKELKVKFIYLRNKNLVQLTADFSPDEFNIETNKVKSKKQFKYFYQKFLRRNKPDFWLNIFEAYEIENHAEAKIDLDKLKFILRNDHLFLESLNDRNLKIKNINFNYVDMERLIGLCNVGATCYMNATLQCFINTDMLTRNLLKEENYLNIINKKNICELTSCYCELLSNVCCNININNYYKPTKFKEIISKKNPLFKGIQANDSKDLINFMIEEMNTELNLIEEKENDKKEININMLQVDQRDKYLMLNSFKLQFTKDNKSIIPKIFYSINEIETKCLVCNETKYNYEVSFMFEFVLSSTYEYCLKQNITCLKNNKDICISLLKCFEFHSQPSLFINDNKIYCTNCQRSTEGQYSYNIFHSQPSLFINDNKIYCTNCQRLTEGQYSYNIYSLSPTIIIALNRGKDNEFKCEVDFPEILNLQKYVRCSSSYTIYRLKGVITHLGKSGMSGHFIAHCRHRINNK